MFVVPGEQGQGYAASELLSDDFTEFTGARMGLQRVRQVKGAVIRGNDSVADRLTGGIHEIDSTAVTSTADGGDLVSTRARAGKDSPNRVGDRPPHLSNIALGKARLRVESGDRSCSRSEFRSAFIEQCRLG